MSSPARKRRSPAATSPYRFVVAMRLLRARKINIISILGVMVGVASIIVVMSVMDGFQKELRSKIRGTLSDFIIAINPESVVYEDLKRDVENVDGVDAATIQYHTAVVVPIEHKGQDGGRQSTMLVRLVGIEPGEESRISDFLHYLENEPPDPPTGQFDQNHKSRHPVVCDGPYHACQVSPRILVQCKPASKDLQRQP